MTRPGIIITSPLDADVCVWLSNGWFTEKNRHLPRAQELMANAKAAIAAADNTEDAIKKLTEAGFSVVHLAKG